MAVEKCVDCGRPVRYESDTDRYVHTIEPTVGCFLHAGVYVKLDFDDENLGLGKEKMDSLVDALLAQEGDDA